MAEALSELGVETFAETFGHRYRSEDLNAFLTKNHTPEAYRRLIADPESRTWAAKDAEGALAAYVVAQSCGLPIDDKLPNSGEVLRLYALSSYQGAGLGGQLMDVALEWLEDRFDHIYLSVFSENTGAIRFYERYGFRKIQSYLYMVGDHPDLEFIMKRTDFD